MPIDLMQGVADHEDFRCGICFPYKPFDVLENRVLDIWELPLTVMDGSLFDYQNLTSEDGFQRIKELIESVKKYSGVFVLLWHNCSFEELRLGGWSRVYEKTLACIGKQNIFNDTAKGIVDW